MIRLIKLDVQMEIYCDHVLKRQFQQEKKSDQIQLSREVACTDTSVTISGIFLRYFYGGTESRFLTLDN